eukprot:jgi/Chrzof1/14091/Cz08g24240.t1
MTDPIHHAATANHHPNGVGATAVLPVVSAATALLSVSLYVTAALAQCVMAAHYHQQPGFSVLLGTTSEMPLLSAEEVVAQATAVMTHHETEAMSRPTKKLITAS